MNFGTVHKSRPHIIALVRKMSASSLVRKMPASSLVRKMSASSLVRKMSASSLVRKMSALIQPLHLVRADTP